MAEPEKKEEEVKDTENKEEESSEEERDNQAVYDGPKSESFEYPDNYKEKTIQDSDLPTKLCKVYEIIGQDSFKRYNFYFLSDTDLLISIANTFQIFNIETKERKIIFSSEIGGVGAIAVHPTKEYFAIGEFGNFPNIYIYRYNPETKQKLHRILRKGTENGYSALNFNDKGNYLASVGTDPDYNLVIWNWKNETIILKAKAFSQEIYKVQFSNNFEGKLITSGMGHIRFWEMAETFTGLKLQGELGKFGQVDLSDISSFVEFPDGKVLSGTEHGTLLLWEGIFIKANLSEPEGKKCHEGLVEHMSWELSDNPEEVKIMTAGHDGYVKWWKYLDFENVVLDDFSNGVVSPLRAVQLINPITKKPIKIIGLVKHKDFWMVQDGNGALIKATLKEGDQVEYDVIKEFHSGPALKSTIVPGLPLCITQGRDKKISVDSFASNMSFFPGKIILDDPLSDDGLTPTCCDIPKKETVEEAMVIAVGYSNGMVKIFSLNTEQKKLDCISVVRPHQESIEKIMFSPDCSYLCTITKKEMFFFFVEAFDKVTPWCVIIQDTLQIMDIDWNPDSKRILVGYSNGTLDEIEIPIHFDNTNTFILNEYNKKTFKVKLAENQIEKIDEKKKKSLKEKGKWKEEPEPGSILSCKYIGLYGEDDFIVTSQKPFNQFLHLCTFNMAETNVEKRPINFWKMPEDMDYYIKHISKNYIFLINHKGGIQIRNKKLIDKYIEVFPDVPGTQIKDIATSQDEDFICVSMSDGINIIYCLDNEGVQGYLTMFQNGISEEAMAELNARKFVPPAFEKQDINSVISQMKTEEFNVLEENAEHEKEILSLEDDKQQAHEREKERIANEKKSKLLAKVNKLREDFDKLKTQNSKLPEEIRLTEDELTIDNKYLEIVAKENEENLEDVEHKYKWLKANVNVTINKITSFFLSSVETNKVVVYSLRANEYVSTLRCPALPENFDSILKKLEEDIDEFNKKIDFDSLIPKYQPLLEVDKIDEAEESRKFNDIVMKSEQKKADAEQREITEKQEGAAHMKQADIEILIREIKVDSDEIAELIKSREKEAKKLKNKTNEDNYSDTKTSNICPDYYFMKNLVEEEFNEKNMLTNNVQKRKIYLFLKLLYDERQSFNKKVMDLKEEKLELFAQLKEYKKELERLNELLGVDETYDWYNFENKDTVQDLFKIDGEKLKEYMNGKIAKDKELKAIYDEEANQAKDNKGNSDEDEKWEFVVKERPNKQTYNTNLTDEMKLINDLRNNYQKEQKLKEVNKLIDDFDNKLNDLKSERVIVSFYQKIGEYELLLKQKELNKLRAFESEDKKFCDKLIKLFDEYNINLENLKRSHTYLEESQKDLNTNKAKKEAIEKQFEKLIENERENKDLLERIFRQKKRDLKDQGADDKLDQEEDLNLPKNINPQIKTEIFNLRDQRDITDDEIKKNNDKINNNLQTIENDKKAKKQLDNKKAKFLEKIAQNEKQKRQYINQIDMTMPVYLDQFRKIDPSNSRTLLELGKVIYMSKGRVEKLFNDLKELVEANNECTLQNSAIGANISSKKREKNELEIKRKAIEANFKNEQILKFGLEIHFDDLLEASKKTTIDRYDNEYKKLKIESERKIDAYKELIKKAKENLKKKTVDNTNELKKIKEGLERKQNNDKELEEKNSEITKKNNKKYKMFNLQKKKEKLKDILKLLKQQMEALKKEIDIFRRKGGHIYSTIASNLV